MYQSVVDNLASEQAARMVAMKAATDNAGNLINDLRLVYNKARQASITNELNEIVARQRFNERGTVMSAGKIVQIIGAVIDVEFPQDAVPKFTMH